MFFQTTVPQKKPSERPLADSKRLRCARLTLAELLFVSYTIATPLSNPVRSPYGGTTERQSGLVKEHTCPSRTPCLLTG